MIYGKTDLTLQLHVAEDLTPVFNRGQFYQHGWNYLSYPPTPKTKFLLTQFNNNNTCYTIVHVNSWPCVIIQWGLDPVSTSITKLPTIQCKRIVHKYLIHRQNSSHSLLHFNGGQLWMIVIFFQHCLYDICIRCRQGSRGHAWPDYIQYQFEWITGTESSQIGLNMTTLSNGNIFRFTGPLWGESTGDRWIPLTKPNDRALMFSLSCAWTNSWVNNRDVGDLRCICAHYDVIVMIRGTNHGILVSADGLAPPYAVFPVL